MPLKKLFSQQFFRFLLAGGFAAVVNFLVGHSLQGLLPLYGDVVVGYLAGMVVAFILFERHVFGKNAQSRKKSVWLFITVNFFGLLQTWIIYPLLKDMFFPLIGYSYYAEPSARGIAIITPTLTSFVGHKFFTFKS